MILVDTSAWVEFLRGTGSATHQRLRSCLADQEPLATTEVVAMEVLAGASDAGHLQRLRRLVFGCRLLPLQGLADYEDAAALHRACRARGVPVRRLTGCLIATVALRWAVPILHTDRDFDRIAECTALQIERA